jgi:broad specificity phosphatase PhoE
VATRLYLVRHAHADWTPDEGRPLSLRGRSDARRVADLLAPRRPTGVYASPARRAVETVEGLARRSGLDPILVDDLRERELPPVAPERFAAAVRASWDDPGRPAVEGGESNHAAQARGRAALLDIAARHRGESVVVATHGNLLALALGALDPAYGFAFWRGLTFPDVYEVVLEGGSPTAISRAWTAGLPVIETERLLLRPLSPDDAWFILELVNDPSFIQNIGDRKVRSTVDARHYIRSRAMRTYERQGIGTHAVALRDSGVPIGVCGLLKRDQLEHHDIGFAFLPRYWSKGYAHESAAGVLDHAREVLGLTRVLAFTSLGNEASIALLGKLGFAFEKVVPFEGEEVRLFSRDLGSPSPAP